MGDVGCGMCHKCLTGVMHVMMRQGGGLGDEYVAWNGME